MNIVYTQLPVNLYLEFIEQLKSEKIEFEVYGFLSIDKWVFKNDGHSLILSLKYQHFIVDECDRPHDTEFRLRTKFYNYD